MFEDAFENDDILIKLNDGILCLKYKNPILTLEIAVNVVECRLAVSSGIPYPVFCDISNIKAITPEARKFASTKESSELVLSLALWGVSPLSVFLANFFLKINKPVVPVKLFTDEKNAFVWLKSFSDLKE